MTTRELFRRHPSNPILTAEDWPYPVNAVFNPAAAAVNGGITLLARVEDQRGISHLTVARSANGVDDWKIDTQPLLAPSSDVVTEQWVRTSSRSSGTGSSGSPRTRMQRCSRIESTTAG